MSMLRRVLPAAFAFSALCQGGVFAETDYPMDNEPDSKDIEFLRNWFKTKRAVSIEEKGGELSLSGAVRTEYNRQEAKADVTGADKRELYGWSESTPSNDFKNRVDLFFDYRTAHTWASIKLKFNNRMGALGGQTNRLDLEKAIMGYRVYDNGKAAILDIEAGRTKLYNFFDSKTQFNSLLDGLSLHFGDSIEHVFDLDARVAMGVVDTQFNQYAYFGELDFMDIGEIGLFFKYAYSHWRKHGTSAQWRTEGGTFTRMTTGTSYDHALDNPQFRFQISQFILGYDMDPEVLRFPLKIYGAFSLNHAAEDTVVAAGNTNAFTLPKSQRYAWYLGVTAGKVVKRGDWSVEVIYQSVDAQAIPDYDVAGIGLGNPYGYNMYQAASGAPTGVANLPAYIGPAGNANYRGWTADVMFAITNNISLLLEYDWSEQKTRDLDASATNRQGARQSYQRFGASAIYAF